MIYKIVEKLVILENLSFNKSNANFLALKIKKLRCDW